MRWCASRSRVCSDARSCLQPRRGRACSAGRVRIPLSSSVTSADPSDPGMHPHWSLHGVGTDATDRYSTRTGKIRAGTLTLIDVNICIWAFCLKNLWQSFKYQKICGVCVIKCTWYNELSGQLSHGDWQVVGSGHTKDCNNGPTASYLALSIQGLITQWFLGCNTTADHWSLRGRRVECGG